MAYKISDECINCGICQDACPAEAISEKGNRRDISDACIECGACADNCPANAISK